MDKAARNSSLVRRIKKLIPWDLKFTIKQQIGSFGQDKDKFVEFRRKLLTENITVNQYNGETLANTKKKLKIVYAIHQFFPEHYAGTEQYLLNLSTKMQSYGHNVKIITYQPYPDSDMKKVGDMLMKEYSYKGLDITAIHSLEASDRMSFGFDNKGIMNFFADFFKKEKPDIFHLAHPMHNAASISIAKELKIKTVMTLTDYWLMCPNIFLLRFGATPCMGPLYEASCSRCIKNYPTGTLKKRLVQGRELFNNVDALISPTKFVAKLFEINGYASANIHTIRHGFDKPSASKKTTPHKFFTFGYTGTILPYKGVHLLIKAFKNIGKEDIRLVIYGDTNQDKEYGQYLQKLSASDTRISFRGKYDSSQLADIHSELDAVVVPSICYETYSFTAVAALSYGIPVIAPDLTGTHELIEDGVSGFIFKLGNQDSLRNSLKQALEQKLKERNEITYKWPLDSESMSTLELYNNLLD